MAEVTIRTAISQLLRKQEKHFYEPNNLLQIHRYASGSTEQDWCTEWVRISTQSSKIKDSGSKGDPHLIEKLPTTHFVISWIKLPGVLPVGKKAEVFLDSNPELFRYLRECFFKRQIFDLDYVISRAAS